ncbi:glycoside hydrolase family 10 protein [Leptothoe spongobia]|uniref:Glycoside hydrolase family 10 protein n=1 Tax=Leptothoe spongobia TAU-MAC 1115 TaxID=1967444 RepID=A0A947DH73_9CYAN|nr:glycoside hydrolase family 10 protein [Leptothoe spongobia]MBT9316563.1 glycoside hydrolase family 10 protein [Leptothoe spongobia TAU-MAC 1115]
MNSTNWRWKPLSILLFGFSLLAAIALHTINPAIAMTRTTPAQEIRGVWLTTNDTDVLIDQPKLHSAIDQLAELNFNTLYPVVWNGGYAFFDSGTAKRANIQHFVRRGIQDYDILTELTTKAHSQGMSVIPWFEFGFMAPATSELATVHSSWLTEKRNGSRIDTRRDGGDMVWLNPYKPEVQQFITHMILELISRYDVDGIQFDDHFILPVEFGYDSYTRALYREETGKDVPNDPHNPSWVKWRADKLTAFVKTLNADLKARRRDIIFSVAPNPYDFAYKGQLQDWLTWVRQGWVDELIVQIYRNNLNDFRHQLYTSSIRETQQKIPTAAGILTGLRNTPVRMSFIESKVRAARSAGLGMTFFFYESLWEDAPEPADTRQASFRNLFATPTQRGDYRAAAA